MTVSVCMYVYGCLVLNGHGMGWHMYVYGIWYMYVNVLPNPIQCRYMHVCKHVSMPMK